VKDCPRCEGPLIRQEGRRVECPTCHKEWIDPGPTWSLAQIRQRVATIREMARRGEL